MRCERLHATISENTCVALQKKVSLTNKDRRFNGLYDGHPCRKCKDGIKEGKENGYIPENQ